MRSNLTLADWIIVAVLIGVINLCVRWLDKPIFAEAQSKDAGVAAAISADGSRAVIVKESKWMVIKPQLVDGITNDKNW
jgi:hypothetical protein